MVVEFMEKKSKEGLRKPMHSASVFKETTAERARRIKRLQKTRDGFSRKMEEIPIRAMKEKRLMSLNDMINYLMAYCQYLQRQHFLLHEENMTLYENQFFLQNNLIKTQKTMEQMLEREKKALLIENKKLREKNETLKKNETA